MGSKPRTLHIFFPFLAHGHMIPTVGMAKLFASKGVKATIITTPLNEPFVSKAIGKAKTYSNRIHIQTIEFPCAKAGLPDGCENVDSIPSPDLVPVFFESTKLLRKPFEQLLLQHRPDCVIVDVLFPWATDSAAMLGIPRLVFHGTCFFALCAIECMELYEPYKNVSSDSECFVIPNLPGEIKLTRMQVPPSGLNNDATNPITRLLQEAKESELRSYGVVVNSFYELEHAYADHYRNVLGKKAWHIGPLSLCNRDNEEKARRGKDASIAEHDCLKWLDTKKPNSVICLSFGSVTDLPNSQLRDIAVGLEASGQQFIWVVKKSKKNGEDGEEWLPEGFEKRMEGKGLIIRGWAPQVLILEHEAIGAFVTHCGWNSTLEAVSAGLPMVTWPIAAEQFYNEKLITEVLKIGLSVGAKKWARLVGDSVKWDAVEKAVKRVMVGEEAVEMRNKAKVLSQLARQAVEKGGSSYSDLNALLEALGSHNH